MKITRISPKGLVYKVGRKGFVKNVVGKRTPTYVPHNPKYAPKVKTT